MICANCGTENQKNAKFCRSCGAALPAETQLHANAGSIVQGLSRVAEAAKTLPRRTILGVCGAAAVLAVAACMAGSLGKTVDLNKYMTIEVDGYNGYGTARAVIDWEAIDEKYGEKLNYTAAAKKEYGDLLELTTPEEALKSAVNIDLDKRKNLKNGDTIQYTWEVDKALPEVLNCKVKCKGGEYKVTELEEVQTFDAFADVEVKFDGIAPNGSVSMTYRGTDLSSYDFTCEPAHGVANGDTVTVSIKSGVIDDMAKNQGKVPAESEKTYVVAGLDEIVGSYADLTEDDLAGMKAEAEDVICAYTAKSYAKTSKVTDLQYAGYIMNTRKQDAGWGWGGNNALYLIYSATVSNEEGDFPTTTVYFPVKFSNLMNRQDGFGYDSDVSIVGNASLNKNSWGYTTRGYTDAMACYLDLADYTKNEYNVEVGDGFEKYRDYKIVTTLGDLDESFKTVARDAAKATIESYAADKLQSWATVSELSYVGDFLLSSKNYDKVNKQNAYTVVYKATLSSGEAEFEAQEVYFPVEYNGIVKLTNGEYIVLEHSGMQGKTNVYYNINGYTDPAAMYTQLITAHRDSFNYEASEAIQQFAN